MPSPHDIGLSKGPSAAVVGGGPAGLIAAETLAQAGVAVTVYDRMPSLGRKFLLAWRGGLNLTHSEDLPAFLARYGNAAPLLREAIEAFPPLQLRAWAEGLGQPTFVGSSGRVFPRSFKTSPLLRAWLRRLTDLKVSFAPRHDWTGWNDEGALCFRNAGKDVMASPDVTVLALGGGSWPKLGSDGSWTSALQARGVAIALLRPANCGFTVNWTEKFRSFEGVPLKTIALRFNGQSLRGECIVTRDGLEGGAIYALSAPIRETIDAKGAATIHIDLCPDVTAGALIEKLNAPRGKQSLSNTLRKVAKLSPVAIGLLYEAALSFGKSLSALKIDDLASLIKSVPVPLTGAQLIETAISSAGGIAFDALDENFMLKKMPGTFAAGEMLDWEAPTGGYLLQASFTTGMAAARGALAFLKAKTD
jgi:uncharacterized flavoprotein (TIGR03862 family)